MALSKCLGCTTEFAVGLVKCPQCGSMKHHEVGGPKPKPKPKPKP